ncbi:MAG: hypothetical protein IKM99_09330 [Bacteroidales bacterium]|nr:hypothetical protein [Bacteroidales bacterium]
MKKTFTLLALSVLLPLFAAAQFGRQPVSIIGHLSGGWGGFPEKSIGVQHWIGAVGADAKIGLTNSWSLLVGLDYQFRFINEGYTGYNGLYNTYNHTLLKGHYLRLPVRMEYDHNWFYLAVGPYLEKGFGNITETYDVLLVGINLELGGRLELNHQDHLRIGLLNTAGCSLQNRPSNSLVGYYELNWLLRVGYEHRL